MKTCPHCAEEIQDAAMKCRHCGRAVVDQQWQQFCDNYRTWAPAKRTAEFNALTEAQKTQFNAAWTALGYDTTPATPAPAKPRGLAVVVGCAVIALILSVVFIAFLWNADVSDDSPREKPEIVHNSAWDGGVRQVEQYLERTLKDPDSFDAIEWGTVQKLEDGSFRVWCSYRAKNSFGGYVVARQLFTLDAKGNVASAVNLE